MDWQSRIEKRSHGPAQGRAGQTARVCRQGWCLLFARL